MLSKRSTVMGLPVGPRRTDWQKVGRLGAAGVSAMATVVGGVEARRHGDKSGNGAGPGLVGKAGQAVTHAAGNAVGQGAKRLVTEAAGKAVTAPIRKAGEKVSEAIGGGGAGGGERNVKKQAFLIREHVNVGAPLKTAYNQWTQFTEFPSIMKGVVDVQQEEDDVLKWTAKIGPSRRQWEAEITQQIPDQRIAWKSTDGTENRGTVTFHRLDRNLTRVQLEMEYFPNGIVEKVGNLFRSARRRARKDLRLFKHYVELAGKETGAWRGEIAKDGESRQERLERQRDERGEPGRGREGEEGREEETAEAEPAEDEAARESEAPDEQATQGRTPSRGGRGRAQKQRASSGRTAARRPAGKRAATGTRTRATRRTPAKRSA